MRQLFAGPPRSASPRPRLPRSGGSAITCPAAYWGAEIAAHPTWGPHAAGPRCVYQTVAFDALLPHYPPSAGGRNTARAGDLNRPMIRLSTEIPGTFLARYAGCRARRPADLPPGSGAWIPPSCARRSTRRNAANCWRGAGCRLRLFPSGDQRELINCKWNKNRKAMGEAVGPAAVSRFGAGNASPSRYTVSLRPQPLPLNLCAISYSCWVRVSLPLSPPRTVRAEHDGAPPAPRRVGPVTVRSPTTRPPRAGGLVERRARPS